MATDVVHLNGTKQLDCLLRHLQIDSIRVDKKRCSSLNGVCELHICFRISTLLFYEVPLYTQYTKVEHKINQNMLLNNMPILYSI